MENISIKSIIDYEIKSSWWASSVSNPYLQDLGGKYFAWKVKRKYGRYKLNKMWEEKYMLEIALHKAHSDVGSHKHRCLCGAEFKSTKELRQHQLGCGIQKV